MLQRLLSASCNGTLLRQFAAKVRPMGSGADHVVTMDAAGVVPNTPCAEVPPTVGVFIVKELQVINGGWEAVLPPAPHQGPLHQLLGLEEEQAKRLCDRAVKRGRPSKAVVCISQHAFSAEVHWLGGLYFAVIFVKLHAGAGAQQAGGVRISRTSESQESGRLVSFEISESLDSEGVQSVNLPGSISGCTETGAIALAEPLVIGADVAPLLRESPSLPSLLDILRSSLNYSSESAKEVQDKEVQVDFMKATQDEADKFCRLPCRGSSWAQRPPLPPGAVRADDAARAAAVCMQAERRRVRKEGPLEGVWTMLASLQQKAPIWLLRLHFRDKMCIDNLGYHHRLQPQGKFAFLEDGILTMEGPHLLHRDGVDGLRFTWTRGAGGFELGHPVSLAHEAIIDAASPLKHASTLTSASRCKGSASASSSERSSQPSAPQPEWDNEEDSDFASSSPSSELEEL